MHMHITNTVLHGIRLHDGTLQTIRHTHFAQYRNECDPVETVHAYCNTAYKHSCEIGSKIVNTNVQSNALVYYVPIEGRSADTVLKS